MTEEVKEPSNPIDPKDLSKARVYDVDVDEVLRYELEHADEIAAEEGKKFELTGSTTEEQQELAAATTGAVSATGAAAKTEQGAERESIITKISKMNVGARVKLAMLGNKEERGVLIRDASKVVSSAVLASPKLTDQEVELIAAMKNVQESVLRDIQRNRKFMKNYNVVKNLINNPRCPLDLSLNMVKLLMVNDLKGLSMNKNVPETLKKIALKNFKEKSGPQK
jgi:hypothetical protein